MKLNLDSLMAEPTWSFSQAFSNDFQTRHADLNARFTKAEESSLLSEVDFQNFNIELSKLSKDLASATGSLPSYDQRQYELQIRELEKALVALRTKSTPRTRFSFKRRTPASAPPSNEEPSSATTTSAESSGPLAVQTNNLSISSKSNEYITLESLPPMLSGHDLTISDLNNCIVNLTTPMESSGRTTLTEDQAAISAIHIQNLVDTILLLPDINGSVLLHDLSRCTLVLGCRQFRMHSSTDVDVFLSITSNPIIEHCSRIQFSAYPPGISTSTTAQTNAHFSVLDFSHIRSTPSPNWSTMSSDHATPNRTLLSKPNSSDDLVWMLDAFLPRAIQDTA